MTLWPEAADYLLGQSGPSLAALYWFFLVFEVPRYVILFALFALMPRRRAPTREFAGRVSVVIAGHNEARSIEACVRALEEQSRPPDEIVVVSDGSSDGMDRRLGRMLADGRITAAHATDLRGGKSAASNMAARLCTGDVIVNVDCDCSFDRHALRNILRPLSDRAVGASCGNILPRNPGRSLVTAFQGIEYLVTISLGKQAADRVGQVTCVSGAFGAFRREAYEFSGGLDAGGGEDLDLTIRLRAAGWKVRFAGEACCYTDVPETLRALVRQRFRWERDSVHLRYRKHAGLMNPFSPRFRWSEFLHEVEFLIFNVLAAAVMPVYIAWLFGQYGGFALTVMAAAQLGLMALDHAVFLMAAAVTPFGARARLVPFLAGYSVFNGLLMRGVRLAAYVQEWAFRASFADGYVPAKVHRVRR